MLDKYWHVLNMQSSINKDVIIIIIRNRISVVSIKRLYILRILLYLVFFIFK